MLYRPKNLRVQILFLFCLQSDLQTSSQKIPLSAIRAPCELQPRHTVDEVIHHEVTELGTHMYVLQRVYLYLDS
jgi:Protein of unknown function (DUF974)